MGDATIKGLLSLLSSDESARVILITLILLLALAIITTIFLGYLAKTIKTIKHDSKEEYADEQQQLEYRKKVDSTQNDIKYITELLVRLTETVNLSNVETKQELESIKEAMSEHGAGCVFGQDLAKEVETLRDEILKSMKDDVTLLLESDRERIKSFITGEYHKWMKLGYIDMYTLKALDEQFQRYTKEHGNTFVEDMMKELHTLEVRCITQNCTTARLCRERDTLQILATPHGHEDESTEALVTYYKETPVEDSQK